MFHSDNFTEYQQRHASFVSGHSGGSVQEVMLIACLGPLSVLLRNLAIPWLFPASRFASGRLTDAAVKHVLDVLLCCVPTILCVTVCASAIPVLVLCMCLACTTIVLFCVYEYCSLYRHRLPLRLALNHTVDNARPLFLTYLRSYSLISTAILILAVDFSAMPRRFAKTESFGYSIMDTGVGCFAFINGFTAPETRIVQQTLVNRVKGCLGLLVLGCIRLVSIKVLGYHEHVTEYGLHCNFFFTLAAIRMMSSLLGSVLPLRSCSGILSILIACSYQMLLSHSALSQRILHGWTTNDTRDTFLDANREGIFSLFGFLAIYLAALQLGVSMQQPRARLKHWLVLYVRVLVLLVVLFAIFYTLHMNVAPASRRMANLTYTVWILFVVLFMLSGFLCIEVCTMFACVMQLPLFSNGETPSEQLSPCLLHAINQQSMHFFVLCNVVTGLVNLSIRTLHIADTQHTALLLTLYLLCTTAIVHALHTRRDTLARRGAMHSRGAGAHPAHSS